MCKAKQKKNPIGRQKKSKKSSAQNGPWKAKTSNCLIEERRDFVGEVGYPIYYLYWYFSKSSLPSKNHHQYECSYVPYPKKLMILSPHSSIQNLTIQEHHHEVETSYIYILRTPLVE